MFFSICHALKVEGGEKVAFNENAAKLKKRTREIRDLGLGLAQSIVRFKNLLCISPLLCASAASSHS